MTAEPDPREALAEAYDRALALEKAGRRDDAAAAWREVLALDPADHGGAAVRLAALGAAPPPDRAPPAYVETLFDQHAEAFDEILVGRLGYDVPAALAAMLTARLGGRTGLSTLDLGCGTGLMGLALGEIAGELTGVDLSEGMLAMADEREIYDQLYVGDAVAFLEAPAEDEDGDTAGPWQLICAADVVPYLGGLERLFAGAAAQLVPGGWLAFSTETAAPEDFGGRDWFVGPHHRFHHSESYLRAALAEAGFAVRAVEPAVIRLESGRPVPGHLVLAVRSSPED